MNVTVPTFPVPEQPVPVVFSGERGAFFKLISRGALLELITAGFYRFWLVTDIRRHLWSHTVIEGDALEYTGRGRELLIGFLIATAILLPIYLAYFIIGLEAERAKAFGSVPLVAFLYVFGQFAIYRARRYRLSRTVWRGVRFWMSGSGWVYALRAALWGVAVVLTLGLALPWRDAALERYKMRHTFYGDLQGSFEGRGGEFFRQAWWLWPLAAVSIVLFPLLPFVYGAFRAIQWRWWMSGIRFGKVRFESGFRSLPLITFYWKVIAWTIFLTILLIVYFVIVAAMFGVRTGSITAETVTTLQSIPFLVATVIGYLGVLLAFGIVFRLYLTRDFWAYAAGSVAIHGLSAVDAVTAKGELANAIGEGFADGLDVGGL